MPGRPPRGPTDASSPTTGSDGNDFCPLPLYRLLDRDAPLLHRAVYACDDERRAGDLRGVHLPVPFDPGPVLTREGDGMRVPAPGGALVSSVEVTAATVQRGDIIELGGQACRVSDLFQLPQGAKQLVFESGELLAIHARTRLIALRLLRRR